MKRRLLVSFVAATALAAGFAPAVSSSSSTPNPPASATQHEGNCPFASSPDL